MCQLWDGWEDLENILLCEIKQTAEQRGYMCLRSKQYFMRAAVFCKENT